MQIRTRMCTSLDGYISNADGLPVQLSDPEFDPEAYGFVELQSGCDAVLMGITTLGPAIGADRWLWSDVNVFVLGSERPHGSRMRWSSTGIRSGCSISSARPTVAATST